MKKLISIRLASNIILIINTLALLMYILILLKILPTNTAAAVSEKSLRSANLILPEPRDVTI